MNLSMVMMTREKTEKMSREGTRMFAIKEAIASPGCFHSAVDGKPDKGFGACAYG